jgi:hypothetical protein
MRRSLVLALALFSTSALAQQPTTTPVAPPTAPAPAPAAPPAAPAPPADPNLEQARLHFEQGVALFNDQNFNGALAEFMKAYELRRTPAVLYNIGLAQKALFHYAEAIDSMEKFLADSPNLSPERRADVQQQIAEIRALIADVTVQVEPAGAIVSVDGRTVGQSPLPKALGIAAGNHTIEVTADGYKPQRRELLISAGTPLAVQFKLEAIPRTGKVHVTSTLPSATIAVDGRAIGSGQADIELGAGGHTLEVAAPHYLLHREELVVAAGQTRSVQVTLLADIPPKRFYQKWYFWTPIVAVVAGAAVATGVVLGTRQSPVEGTLSPGIGGVQ